MDRSGAGNTAAILERYTLLLCSIKTAEDASALRDIVVRIDGLLMRGLHRQHFTSSAELRRIMERHRNWFCTVVDMKSQDRYVCFTRRKGGGGLCVNVTDAAAVWSADCSEDVLKPQDVEPHGDVRVVVQHTRAVLHVGSGSRPAAFSVTLTRMEAPQATEALKELLFTMADTLTQLDSLFVLFFHPVAS